jgi:Spy/CpxP family protein refolding chaperone
METKMTEPSPQAPDNPERQPRPKSSRRRAFAVIAIVLAAGLTGAAVTKAVSSPRMFGHGWHGGPASNARIEDRADRMVRHLAVEIDATAEQQEKLRGLMKAALADVLPAREKAWAARTKARELLAQPKIDRAEIEKLRAEQVALADSLSKRIAQAVLDAAEMLTPEQRKKLNDSFPPIGGYWHGWRRG